MGEHERDTGNETPEHRGGLPRWMRVGIVGSFAVGLLTHIAYDATSQTYEGASVSLMLGGVVGAALSLDEYLRRGGGGDAK